MFTRLIEKKRTIFYNIHKFETNTELVFKTVS